MTQALVKKLYDAENSNWAFRLTIQISNLSKAVLHSQAEQEVFREAHERLFQSMRECHDAQLEFHRFIDQHLEDVAAGRCIEINNGHLVLLEDIEPALNRLFKDFFVKARTVLYHLFGQKPHKGSSYKSVTEVLLSQDLGFVQLGDDTKFETKAQEFVLKAPGEAAKGLIDMLRGDRKSWSSELIDIRNTIIHDVKCPRLEMKYALINGMAKVGFPTINKMDLHEFVRLFWDNLYEAVEDAIIGCINIKLSSVFVICRIAEGARDPQYPVKYQISMRPAHIPVGVIVG